MQGALPRLTPYKESRNRGIAKIDTIWAFYIHIQPFWRLKRESKFSKFLEIFKKLNVNVHCTYDVREISSCVESMKEIPSKLKDSWHFTLLCMIGTTYFGKVLCDLGANINLLSFSMFQELKFGEFKPTSTILHIMDDSMKHPRGVVENVLINFDKYYFFVNFILLHIEVDWEIPLIFSRLLVELNFMSRKACQLWEWGKRKFSLAFWNQCHVLV